MRILLTEYRQFLNLLEMKTQFKYSLSLRFNHLHFLPFMGKTFSADFSLLPYTGWVNIYLATVNKYICSMKDTECLNTCSEKVNNNVTCLRNQNTKHNQQ